MLFQKSGGAEWLIAGLGNPGDRYANTRHNVGFRVTELLERELNTRCTRARFHALCGLGSWQGTGILLLRPQTFMNLSGQAVAEAARFYRIPPERCLIIFDDISLPPGRLRVRRDGSAGGHNGVKSIIACLGSQDFPRVKIGVGAKPHPDYDLAAWVLGKFPAEDAKALADRYPDVEAAAKLIMDGKLGLAQSKYNG